MRTTSLTLLPIAHLTMNKRYDPTKQEIGNCLNAPCAVNKKIRTCCHVCDEFVSCHPDRKCNKEWWRLGKTNVECGYFKRKRKEKI